MAVVLLKAHSHKKRDYCLVIMSYDTIYHKFFMYTSNTLPQPITV